jgi:hypothetical protein
MLEFVAMMPEVVWGLYYSSRTLAMYACATIVV